MVSWIDVTRVAAGANVVLLVGLSYVWARNYRQFRSKHALGLFVFGVLLLAENAVAFYVFSLDPVLSDWFASSSNMPNAPGTSMMVLRVLETGALLFLTWITWD